ncbi:MAG TPA: PilZ domain-containing protein [Pyrinomonadaceae bacterium]|jgi:hypothetical protein|nr:PilZ domain-containing protein [Pyrinomonadaceae bacterium]
MTSDFPPSDREVAREGAETTPSPVDERRIASRVRVSLPVRWEGISCTLSGEIVDLSPSGCFILTDDKVEEGELIRVGITLPSGESLLVWGEVVYRVTEIGFGLRFTGSSDDDFKLFGWLVAARASQRS